MHAKTLKEKSVILRKEGHSYSQISAKLLIAKSTLSLWLKDVEFIPTELTFESKKEANRKSNDIKRVDKLKSVSEAFEFAKNNIAKLSDRDLFVLGIGIYIGEGSKVGNSVRISNSDPRIIRFSINWFKKCFGLVDYNFKVRIHMYPDNNEGEVINFWIKNLKLKKDNFYPSSFDRRINKQSKNRNTLPYGTAHLSVVSNGDKNLGVLLHRKILASINFVLK